MTDDRSKLRALGDVRAHDVRVVAQRALSALGVNLTVSPLDAETVLQHGLTRLSSDIRAFADLLGEDHEHFDVIVAIGERATFLGDTGYLLAQLNGSESAHVDESEAAQ